MADPTPSQGTGFAPILDRLTALGRRIARLESARVGAGVLSPGIGGTGTTNAYANDLGSATRRAAYVDTDGRLGYATSSQRYKRNIRTAPFSATAWMSVRAVVYRRVEDGAERGPHAPLENGLIAEQLDELGLSGSWLYRDGEGRAEGIDYAALTVPVLQLAQHATRTARRAQQEARAVRDTQKAASAEILELHAAVRAQMTTIRELSARVAAMEGE